MGTTCAYTRAPAAVSARCVRRRSAGAVVRRRRPAASRVATARLTATLSMAVRAVTSAADKPGIRGQHGHDAPFGDRQAEVREIGRRDRGTHGVGQAPTADREEILPDGASRVASWGACAFRNPAEWLQLKLNQFRAGGQRWPVTLTEPNGHRRLRVRRIRRARSRRCCAACSSAWGSRWSPAIAARTSRCIRRATSTS